MRYTIGSMIVAIALLAVAPAGLMADPPEGTTSQQPISVTTAQTLDVKPAATQSASAQATDGEGLESQAASPSASPDSQGGEFTVAKPVDPEQAWRARIAALDMIHDWQHTGFVGIIDLERFTRDEKEPEKGAWMTCTLYVGADGAFRVDHYARGEGRANPIICGINGDKCWLVPLPQQGLVHSVSFPPPETEKYIGEFGMIESFSRNGLDLASRFGCGLREGKTKVTVQEAAFEGDQLVAKCMMLYPLHSMPMPATLRGSRDSQTGRFVLSSVDNSYGVTKRSDFMMLPGGGVLARKMVHTPPGESEPSTIVRVKSVEPKERTDYAFHHSTFPEPTKSNGGLERFPDLQTTFVYDNEGKYEVQNWHWE